MRDSGGSIINFGSAEAVLGGGLGEQLGQTHPRAILVVAQQHQTGSDFEQLSSHNPKPTRATQGWPVHAYFELG